MAVSQQDAFGLETFGLDESRELCDFFIRMASRVNNGTFSVFVPCKKTVCLKTVEGEMFYMYHQKNS